MERTMEQVFNSIERGLDSMEESMDNIRSLMLRMIELGDDFGDDDEFEPTPYEKGDYK